MNPFYVILLALLNDISMIPISSDNASPSARPEIPSMPQILLAAVIYGGLLTCQSLAFFEYGLHSDWLPKLPNDPDATCTPDSCDYLSTALYLQISIAIEFVILSCRAPGFVLAPKYLCGDGRTSIPLLSGIMFANILVTVLAGTGVVGFTKVEWRDIGYIWAYDVVGLVVIDIFKVV